MVAISLHLLWLMSNTTKDPTTSEFLQLFRTSAKFFQSAFFAILYQAFRDALHSLCLAAASRIAFRRTIRMTNLRIMRREESKGTAYRALTWDVLKRAPTRTWDDQDRRCRGSTSQQG